MIEIRDLAYAIGSFRLQASLRVAEAEYFVLLGVTGSGKTILLETLCGLRRAAAGRVLLNGRDVTPLPPRRRQVGYVPQDGALFDHLSVADNIGFAPRLRRAPAEERRATVRANAALLGIVHLLPRGVQGLSGGERQRVALARALAAKSSLLLLDEPVSALDEPTRNAVCRELKRIQRDLRLSVIHVCHSLEEATLLGDRIGIMRAGTIVQADSLEGLMNRPRDTYVAGLLRLDNLFSGEARAEGGRGRILCRGADLAAPAAPAPGPAEFMIRPWQVELTPEDAPTGYENSLPGTVTAISVAGPLARLEFTGALPLTAYMSRTELREKAVREGVRLRAAFPAEAIHVFATPA